MVVENYQARETLRQPFVWKNGGAFGRIIIGQGPGFSASLRTKETMREIGPDELATCNGENERPAYIGYQGGIFDVTGSTLWKRGAHMQRHRAGRDLTTEIQAAPHGPEVLDRYPQVGKLIKEAAPEPLMPKWLLRLLTRFPMLRRHPHPMTVHFPIVFMFSATTFTLLYLITRLKSFESTAFNCLAAGVVFTPAAMATGYFTWWLNYRARSLGPVTMKQRLSAVLLAFGLIALIWRIAAPDILDRPGLPNGLYSALVLSLFPLAAVIGWLGARLTFPVEK